MRQKHEYYLGSDEPLGNDVSNWIYKSIFRTDVSQPGFVLINLPTIHDSRQLRREMVRLKESLDVIHQMRTGKHLVYTSMGRFDQQIRTKPHRDGGPEESVLMLGYEPTSVRSQLYMADHTNCAFDLGIRLISRLEGRHKAEHAERGDGEQKDYNDDGQNHFHAIRISTRELVIITSRPSPRRE